MRTVAVSQLAARLTAHVVIRARRELADRMLQRFEQAVVPKLATLPRQVVHGDVNDYNVLVAPQALVASGDERVTGADVRHPSLQREHCSQPIDDQNLTGQGQGVGVIDFGDMVHTARVCNLGVALAYICMGKDDPLSVASTVVAAYVPLPP